MESEMQPSTDVLSVLPEEERAVVLKLKAEGVDVHLATIGVTNYYFRPFSRREWQKVLEQQEEQANTGKFTASHLSLEMENNLLIRCLLLPKVDLGTVKDLPGGVVTVLANLIMEASGFDQRVTPTKL